MELQQPPGQTILQIRNLQSNSSLRPMVVPEPVVCTSDFIQHPRQEYPNYKRGLAKMLGVIQLSSGVLCMLLNTGMAFVNYNQTWHIAAGWWASPIMILAGSFALSSTKVVNKLTVHATLWLSLLSSFLTIAVIVQGTMSLLMGRVCGKSCYVNDGQEIAHYVLSSFFMIFGIFEFCASICQFVIGCQAVCIPSRPPLPFDSNLPQDFGFSYTNSAFPPPPPPYDPESQPENIIRISSIPDGATSGSDPYLPSYEESVQKT